MDEWHNALTLWIWIEWIYGVQLYTLNQSILGASRF